jgi:hypothetical protein
MKVNVSFSNYPRWPILSCIQVLFPPDITNPAPVLLLQTSLICTEVIMTIRSTRLEPKLPTQSFMFSCNPPPSSPCLSFVFLPQRGYPEPFEGWRMWSSEWNVICCSLLSFPIKIAWFQLLNFGYFVPRAGEMTSTDRFPVKLPSHQWRQ